MKKNYILPLMLCISVFSFGQHRESLQMFTYNISEETIANTEFNAVQLVSGDVYYEQNFNNFTHGDMTFIDNDGLTPNENVAFIGSNWKVLNQEAVSTSYLINGNKTSDNWMITPSITLGTKPFLTWDARSVVPTYPDGYRVLISTTGQEIEDFTTVLFETSSETGDFSSHLVDLQAYEGQDVYIAFHHNTRDNYILVVDNILVSKLDDFDISINSIAFNKYLKPNEETLLSITISNPSIGILNSIDINYQINDNPVKVTSIDTLNMSYGEKLSFMHTDTISLLNEGSYNLKVWISNMNGGTDDKNANDTIENTIYVVDSDYQKKVLLEEYTGTWCGWCPDGFVKLEELLEKYDNLIGVCAHSSDTMATEETKEVIREIVTGIPSATVDRYKSFDNDLALGSNSWEANLISRLEMAVPVDVDFTFTYNENTREIIVDASARFSQEMTENFRFNCYVIEDNIDNAHVAFNQNNYFSNNNDYPDHPFYSRPNPVTDIVHKHVIREMLGGPWGEEGSIPASVVAGQAYTHRFTHTLSNNYNSGNIKLVVIVQEYNEDVNKRAILNAQEHDLLSNSINLIDKDGWSIQDGDTIIVDGLSTKQEIKFQLSVKNNGSETKEIGVEKTVIEKINGTTNTFCWGGSCFADDVTTSTNNSVIEPDAINDEFRVDFAPSGNYGTQKMRYTFFNANNIKDKTSVNVYYNIAQGTGSSSTKSLNVQELVKYGPNPVNIDEVLSIDFSETKENFRSISMFDNTGRILFNNKISDNSSDKLEINLKKYNISAGTYYVVLLSGKRNIALPVVIIE